ncbi:uncharacterized protein LOC132048747 [Lycium ferocissimum]|uniref:uncharacterized protein LOC132048747 n=1 Tax=Lycium ferocissimum TaxID=112874 RepID=UPI0028159DD5|nr:uncharacterized protein LOC132048747 [Lycium ferocissimum]
MDPLRYILFQPMPIGKLAKWKMLLSEFDIVYIAQKPVKGQALADLLAASPVNEELEPLHTHFPDKGVLAIEKGPTKSYIGWKLFFDGAINYKGSEIGAVLISENGQHYPMAKNKKILLYVNLAQRLCKKFRKIEFRHTLRAQNEFADTLATIASMIQHRESCHIDLLRITLKEEHAHCCHVEAEPDGKLWYNDIKMYLEKREYLEGITNGQKKTIRRMANDFFLNKEILYKRMRIWSASMCMTAKPQTSRRSTSFGTYGSHMNGFVLRRRFSDNWMTMENDCCKYVQRCHQCQIHGDLIKVPPSELNVMSSPWPFVAWGMDFIGPMNPRLQIALWFILVAIDNFTKWVEATSHKSVTKESGSLLRAQPHHMAIGSDSPKKIKTTAGIKLSKYISSHEGHRVLNATKDKISSHKG